MSLVLGLVRQVPSAASKIGVLPTGAAIAFCATLLVNSVRILVAIELGRGALSWGALTAERIHRFEGVVVYLGSLCLLYVVVLGAATRLARRTPAHGRS